MYLTFHTFRKVNVARCNEVFKPLDSWSPTDWACALAGEVGELCNLIKKQRRGDQVSIDDLSDEAADVLCYLDLLCARLRIDLTAATMHKFDRVSVKMGSRYFLTPFQGD